MINLDDVKQIQARGKCIYDRSTIEAAIATMAKDITAVLSNEAPLFLCTMNGALIFSGQLLTQLQFPLQVDYIHTSRFQGRMNAGDLHWIALPKTSLENRTVVILEDILDSGVTLSAIVDYCKQKKAKAVYTAVLIDKNHPRDENGLEKADFTGLRVEDKFLIGYGLDYQGFLRNLPGIYEVE